MENNTIEKTYVDVLSDLVDRGYVEKSFEYFINNQDIKLVTPICSMLTPLKAAMHELYALTERLCGCVGQIAMCDFIDGNNEWDDEEVCLPFVERRVAYTVDLSSESPVFKRKLEIIYTEHTCGKIYELERDFIAERLNDCLGWLNAYNEDDLEWEVLYADYKDERLKLVIDAYRKDNEDNDND